MVAHIGSLDHASTSHTNVTKKMVPNFKSANFMEIRQKETEMQLLDHSNVEEAWEIFTNQLIAQQSTFVFPQQLKHKKKIL